MQEVQEAMPGQLDQHWYLESATADGRRKARVLRAHAKFRKRASVGR